MLLSVMLYYVKVQNFNLQQAYMLYAARRTVGVDPDYQNMRTREREGSKISKYCRRP